MIKIIYTSIAVALFMVSSNIAFAGTQTFTSDGTFTVPAGVTTVSVSMSGGGGGGGGSGGGSAQFAYYGGGGGGGGEVVSSRPLTVIPSTSYTIMVGARGNYGDYGFGWDSFGLGGAGGTGGDSIFGNSLLVAKGGTGGGGGNGYGGGYGGAAGGPGGYNGVAGCGTGYAAYAAGGVGGGSLSGTGGRGGGFAYGGSCGGFFCPYWPYYGDGEVGGVYGGGGGGGGYYGYGHYGAPGFVTVSWEDSVPGTVNVSSNISSSWTITGPATISGSGTSQSSPSQPTGTYTIAWGNASGYVTPSSQSLTLTSGGTITFSGTYTVIPMTPTNLTVIPQACGTGQNFLDWDDATGATSYSIYNSAGTWIGNSIGSNYTHTGSLNTAYSYYVRTNNSVGIQSGNSATVSGTTAGACVANITATPNTILSGASTTIEWTSTGYTSCLVSGYPTWPAGTSGSQIDTPTTNTQYILGCDGVPADSVEVTVNTPPVLTVSPRIVSSGSSATLTWNTNNGNEALCTLTGGALSTNPLDPAGNDTPTIIDPETGTYIIPSVSARTTYTLTCGALSDTATVEIVPVGHES